MIYVHKITAFYREEIMQEILAIVKEHLAHGQSLYGSSVW